MVVMTVVAPQLQYPWAAFLQLYQFLISSADVATLLYFNLYMFRVVTVFKIIPKILYFDKYFEPK